MCQLNISALITRTAERFPHHPALSYDGRRWTYSDWLARIHRFSQALSDLGVRPGDRVAFHLSASEPSVTTYFACQLLGAVAVPVNSRLASAEVAYVLEDSGARILVYDDSFNESAATITETVRAVRDYISCARDQAALPAGHRSFETLAEETVDRGSPRPAPAPDSYSALVYTSGTTGRPKGVMHSHGNDVAIAMNCVMEYSLSRRDIALHIAPLHHIGGMQAYFIPHVMVGATNVILPRYGAVETLRAIADEQITTLFAVPTQIQQMLFTPGFAAFDLSSLRMITTGGTAISSATMERVIREMCPHIFNGYGMTEASLALLLHPEEALSHLGSCGKPTLITDCRLVTYGEGQGPPGGDEVGELIVRGPQTMSGYWNNPVETDKKIKDGWLYTGDLFSKDADGFYTFQGRVDDLIVCGGENIYPREVEEALCSCPGVRDAAVIGLPDGKWGTIVAAFIVKESAGLTAETIDAFCRSSPGLASFKRPRRITFVDELPTNLSGKVMRRCLVQSVPVEPR